jgi:ribosome-associated heat shock protein Hsp15
LRRWPGCAVADPGAARLRLDKFLWFARVVKTRSAAQALAEQGRLRLNGRVIDRSHAGVSVGDVLSFAVHGRVRVLRVEALPRRRGSPAEASALYCELGEPAAG